MKLACLITLLAAFITLAACAGSGHANNDSIRQLAVGDWKLTAIDGQPVSNRLVGDMRAPEMRIGEDGRLSGFSGVNRFSTACDPVALAQGRFECDAIAGTRMAGPPEAMRLETDVLDRLRRASDIDIENDRLRLSAGGAALLEYHRTP